MRSNLRCLGPLEAVKPWVTKDIVGISRFLDRVWRIGNKPQRTPRHPKHFSDDAQDNQKVSEDIEALRFNLPLAP